MDNILALVAATAILVLIPGPNVALIVANSLRHGCKLGLVTVLGTTLGVALQLSLVITGMATLIGVAAAALSWIKWFGVVYLLCLGVRTWFESAADLDDIEPQTTSVEPVFWRSLGLAVIDATAGCGKNSPAVFYVVPAWRSRSPGAVSRLDGDR